MQSRFYPVIIEHQMARVSFFARGSVVSDTALKDFKGLLSMAPKVGSQFGSIRTLLFDVSSLLVMF